MENFDIKSVFDFLGIDWIVVLIYICAGFIGKAYFPERIHIPFTKKNVTPAWRTLIVGTVLVVGYAFLEFKYPTEFTRATMKKLFVSYFFTIAFYEIALKDTVSARIVAILEKIKPSTTKPTNEAT
jgi:hypothetical protein